MAFGFVNPEMLALQDLYREWKARAISISPVLISFEALGTVNDTRDLVL
jgi:hypothetical protein